MRSKWIGYAAALLLASAVVAASLFAPAALLTRKVASQLGEVRYTDYAVHPARTLAHTPAPSPSPSALPTEPGDQTGSIYRKMAILEQGVSRDLPVTPPYDMDMKTAVSRCIELLGDYMKANAIPPLDNFPGDYPQLNASLRSVDDTRDGEPFDYWSITFSGDPNRKRENGSVSVMLDARTGAIYSIKMYTTSVMKTFNVMESAEYIANSLRVAGKANPMEAETESGQSAVWVSTEKTLFITIYYTMASGGSSLGMMCQARAPE